MHNYGLCGICGAGAKLLTCELCGKAVCPNCYRAGACKNCLAGKR